MIDPSQVTVNDIVFTFQSGYIQMHMQKFVSNQVINFTFQSGYIQIDYSFVYAQGVQAFTFQSGYIQIDYAMRYELVLDVLYIPIWLYSNRLGSR